jgi:PAS domain-containing protein
MVDQSNGRPTDLQEPEVDRENVEDITEPPRVAEALARSEAANRALIEALPDPIFRVSKVGGASVCLPTSYAGQGLSDIEDQVVGVLDTD